MVIPSNQFLSQCHDFIDAADQRISNLKPSQWAESKRVLSSEISPFPGPYSYGKTPYLREIIDCLSPDHPADTVAVMKGAQIGFSTGVIENGIGYIISENPGPTLFLSGHEQLSEEIMVLKIDQMIQSCGIQHLIRPNTVKKKNQRTGDTAQMKEFSGGYLVAGSANNHKLLRQRSVKFGFIDDFEAVKSQSKESGSTEKMIEQRFAAFGDKKKIFYISTPELKPTSNIEPVYLKGDQRKFHVPCPCCGDFISFEWEVDLSGTDGRDRAGITWKVDENGKLIDDSVGYICQSCGGFFDETSKSELIALGEWRPTAEPSRVGYYSYHLSSLYAPPGMYNWTYYVRQFIEAETAVEKKDHLRKAFRNLVLGLPYEQEAELPKATELQKNNIRPYQIGSVPEKISISDGNGNILLLTCAADMNGKEDDARLDFEIVAWSETGASYSIRHGSIGTFVPREKPTEQGSRDKWSYKTNHPKSVWPELSKIINDVYQTDTDRKMKILMFGLDCGHFSNYAYNFVDKYNNMFRVGLKGTPESKVMKFGVDVPVFRHAKERSHLYLVEVNAIKDDVAEMMRLKWDEFDEAHQPEGFMNFPQSSDGLYQYSNYFVHFEAEKRIVESKDGQGIGARWVKKNSAVQNHFWDCRVYNIALREIYVATIFKMMKRNDVKNPTWADYVSLIRSQKK
ncbi:MAG: hypothetical protein EBW87_00220 [Burkholderiaceae bacterium]|nr:hypothetical protein [Burkholderiaceae bacterium]